MRITFTNATSLLRINTYPSIKKALCLILLLLLSSCVKNNLDNNYDNLRNKTENDDRISRLLKTSRIFKVYGINKDTTYTTKSSIHEMSQLDLSNYVEYVDNQWQLKISLEEANKLGISNDTYDVFYKSMIDVNKFIVSSILNYENNKTKQFIRNLYPNKMETRGIEYPTVEENNIYIPNPPIDVNESVALSYVPQTTSFTGPYKILGHIYVQAGLAGIWAYSIHDELYSQNIFATGRRGIDNYMTLVYWHEFVYPLVPQSGRCNWRMIGRLAGADNTPISVTYTSNL